MIPLKLETLLEGKVVEQDRVEYKKGWNPTETIHTICAYANDYPNINGGYIVIGIAEKNGRPVLPPEGIDDKNLDRVQNELFQYCNAIEPRYIPKSEVLEYRGKKVLYLWCPAGDAGPYKAAKDVFAKDMDGRRKDYWIKPSSVKTIADENDTSELFEKFNAVPFDDRVCRDAKIDDVKRAYVEDFLRESNSALAEQIDDTPMPDILAALEVANPTDIGVDIRNIGVLMFSEHPEKFMKDAITELTWFHSPLEEGSDNFTEKTFMGPIHKQIRDALHYIEISVITEKVVKYPDRAEADRFFTYPYAAIEEILVNAQFHRSYRPCDSIQIRIYPSRIMICNTPGPDKRIDMDKFVKGKAVAVRYRNRRIGEFLKEIDLSEKKSTGITKVLNALKVNGSPPPLFETDEERSTLFATIYLHERFDPIVSTPSDEHINEHISEQLKTGDLAILAEIKRNPKITNEELIKLTGKSRATITRRIKALRESGVLIRIGSNKNGYWEVES
jgi:ATP-dependent DNA helicase RecG